MFDTKLGRLQKQNEMLATLKEKANNAIDWRERDIILKLISEWDIEE